MTVPQLPLDIIFDIVDQCDTQTLLSLRLVAKSFKFAVENNLRPRSELFLAPWEALPAWDDISKVVASPVSPPGFTWHHSDKMKPHIKFRISVLDAFTIYDHTSTLGFVGGMYAVQTPRKHVRVKFDGGWELPLRVTSDGVTFFDMMKKATEIAQRVLGDGNDLAKIHAEGEKIIKFKFE